MDTWLSDEVCYLRGVSRLSKAKCSTSTYTLHRSTSCNKVVAMVLHKLEKNLHNMEVGKIFACRGSTVYKYTLLKCHPLADKDKLLRSYINIPLGFRLANIIASFHNTGLSNMCGAIDETHWTLHHKPPQLFIPGNY